MRKTDAYKVLRQEIKWCKTYQNESTEYVKGFIAGLRQAIFLIENIRDSGK